MRAGHTRSEPPRVRLTSPNPAYPPEEFTLEEARIFGRVIGRFHKV